MLFSQCSGEFGQCIMRNLLLHWCMSRRLSSTFHNIFWQQPQFEQTLGCTSLHGDSFVSEVSESESVRVVAEVWSVSSSSAKSTFSSTGQLAWISQSNRLCEIRVQLWASSPRFVVWLCQSRRFGLLERNILMKYGHFFEMKVAAWGRTESTECRIYPVVHFTWWSFPY